MAKDQLKLALFFIVFYNVFNTSEAISKHNKVTVGRKSKDSLCNQYHFAHSNNTYEVVGDDNVIDPPCGVFFIGLGEYNYTYGYEDICYTILDVKVPCGMNNTITIKQRIVDIDSNETHIFLLINESLPVRKSIYGCNSGMTLLNTLFCTSSHHLFLLEVSMDITTANQSGIPSVKFETEKQDDQFFWRLPVSANSATGYANLQMCDCTNGICENCINLKKNEIFMKPEPDKNLDINNIITIIGGIVTSLFVPVIMLLIRNYIKNRTNKKSFKTRRPADGSDSIDAGDDDNDSKNATDGGSYNDLSTNNLLSSPRPSIFSDDISFHSAISSI